LAAGDANWRRRLMRRADLLRWKARWIPASFRAKTFFLSWWERALECVVRRSSLERSVAVPDHSGSASRSLAMSSTIGSGGGGLWNAWRISSGVQFRAGAAAVAQARASV